ncbi:MAG: ABC transporter permease [Nocardioides sp.]
MRWWDWRWPSPLALLARRHRRLEAAIVGTATGLYTIPSLALLPLLVPFTGITATTVVIGLALYCLTILVRALLDGLRSVPPGRGGVRPGWGTPHKPCCGGSSCPPALPVVTAGLRVATAPTVALTHRRRPRRAGLGKSDPGRRLPTSAPSCSPRACSAWRYVALDALIVLGQRLLTPWTRRAATG